MRPQLFAAGMMIFALGVAAYVLEVPLAYFWSIPFGVGGALMAGASLFLPEGPGPVEPPEGYRFCVYCSAPVALTAKRCGHCNGVQPAGGA